ncbi:MAG TPA: CBS domain-containing protein [Acetobacteraceae bacterium]|nr:CBS domain-containing protein [Acetobacteraceae bacterium]
MAAMNAADVMTRNVVTVRTETPLADAVALMLARGVSGLPVVDAAGALAGILTEGDLLRRDELGTDPRHAPWLAFLRGPGRAAEEFVRTNARDVGSLMTTGIASVNEATPLADVVALMEQRRIKRVPVLDDGRIVGIVSRADLLRALLPLLAAAPSEPCSDEELEARVAATLTAQGWAPRIGLKLTADAGAITLEGAIFDERERGAIRVAVQNTPGVTLVRDRLVWVEPTTGAFIEAPDA